MAKAAKVARDALTAAQTQYYAAYAAYWQAHPSYAYRGFHTAQARMRAARLKSNQTYEQSHRTSNH